MIIQMDDAAVINEVSEAKPARSEKQTETSRSNGAKSRGPSTYEGKLRSRRNALKHGVFSKVLPAFDSNLCDRQAHDQMLKAMIEDLQPASQLELLHVESIAVSMLRLQRVMIMIESVDFMIDESPGSVMRGNVEDAARIGALADKVQRDFTDGLKPELTAEEADVLNSAIWEHVNRFRRELDSILDKLRDYTPGSDPDQQKLAQLRLEQKNLQRDHQKHGPQSFGLSGQMSILGVLSGEQDLTPKMVRKWVVMLTDLADKQTERASWSRYNNNSADSQMRAHMWTPTTSADYPRRELLLKYESHIRNQLRKDYASLSTVRGLLPAARP